MLRRNFVPVILAVAVPVGVVLAISWMWHRGSPNDNALHAARAAIMQGDHELASELSKQVVATNPKSLQGHTLAALADALVNDVAEAKSHVDVILTLEFDANADTTEDLRDLATTLLSDGSLAPAEKVLRYLLDANPADWLARRSLVKILTITGRRSESHREFLKTLDAEPARLSELLMIADDSTVFAEAIEQLLPASVSNPDDAIVRLGVGWSEQQAGNSSEAELQILRAIELDPMLLAAHAVLGHIYLQRGDDDGFRRWAEHLPADASDSAEIWTVRGLWVRNRAQYDVAARCFWEAAVRDPNHRVAVTELGKMLQHMKRGASEPFLERGDLLRQLWLSLRKLKVEDLREPEETFTLSHTTSNVTMRRLEEVVHLLSQLGRHAEAAAWARASARLDPEASWPLEVVGIGSQVSQGNDVDLTASVDLSDISLAEVLAVVPTNASGVLSKSECQVRFVDEASDTGLNFQYFNSPDPTTDGMRMFEWTGGGVGILDYDLDGWPDVYFSQGCPMLPRSDDHSFANVLFRNFDGSAFSTAGSNVGVGHQGFGQGCAVGDVDNDGFPDIYVCNIGGNCLYRNNGDGTFSDASERLGDISDAWTVSSAIADLNHDGIAEIYDVNYITGEGVFTAMCQHNGVARACQPTAFTAEQDRMLMGTGDGSFIDITKDSGVTVPEGVGLGVVIGDLAGRGKNDIFVANDGFANFHFINSTTDPSDRPRFIEQAMVNGVAYDNSGIPQACMGIAVGDADQNGLADLFVTNFYEESNVLYQQTGENFFVDVSTQADLSRASFTKLGFGAQFLDGELDGMLDLMVTNGDIDDFSTSGRPFRQPAQYFQNLGKGRFKLQASESVGEFFQREQLGRGLARVDWNRDGREDCVISHLDSPAALLTNRTTSFGRHLVVHLKGRIGSRDAVGATVTAKIGTKTLTSFLMAGDGYMASNQRIITIGLGEHQSVDELTIDWPSGRSEQLFGVQADQEIAIVEGSDRTWCITSQR